MSKIINLDDYRPHIVKCITCIKCKYVWIAVMPIKTKKVECFKCGHFTFVEE